MEISYLGILGIIVLSVGVSLLIQLVREKVKSEKPSEIDQMLMELLTGNQLLNLNLGKTK